ncbi:hypothetical protein NM09_18980 [Vibrio caribbeanicus]|uniref:Uncharacterized protein n=1 Tax=Vibrio caribbeanicus TaxID=701175 RepID=A0ACC4NS18_9VIBR|nr:diguanylate cyclase [Vibrio caribbeanicus]KHD23323.1 hypothetical protein NM09_18980 [Vibrio caribbeanicus]
MNNQARDEIQTIYSQFQRYPGIDGAIVMEQQVYAICAKHDIELPLAQFHFIEGLKCNRTDRIAEAIDHYLMCLELVTGEDEILALHANILLATLYTEQENYYSAYLMYKRVIDNSEKLDDNYMSLAYCNVSNLLLQLQQYDMTVDFASKAIASARKVANKSIESISYLNKALALALAEQIHQAIECANHALMIALQIDNPRTIAYAYGYLARIQSMSDDYSIEEVKRHFQLANKYSVVLKDKYIQMENDTYYAQFLEKHDIDSEAIQLCRQLEKLIDPTCNIKFHLLYCQVTINLAKKHNQAELVSLQATYIEAANRALADTRQKEYASIISKVKQTADDQERRLQQKIKEHIEAITEIGQELATCQDISVHLPSIFSKITNIIPSEEFGIALYDEQQGILDYRYFYNTKGPIERFYVDCNKQTSIGSYVVKTKSMVHLNNADATSVRAAIGLSVDSDNAAIHRKADTPSSQSLMFTPILLGNKVLGIMSTQHTEAGQYQPHHCQLFEQLASFIAIALENHVQRHKLQQANNLLDNLSKTDPLTKLYNRYQLDTIAPTLIQKAINQGTQIAIVIIDIDFYKGYNDQFGHQAGDEALKIVAANISNAFSDTSIDHIFRYGGDEFLVLCDGQTDEQVIRKIHQLQSAILSLKIAHPRSYASDYLTLSIGVSNHRLYKEQPLDFNDLFNVADSALYTAKEQGRNQFQLRSDDS